MAYERTLRRQRPHYHPFCPRQRTADPPLGRRIRWLAVDEGLDLEHSLVLGDRRVGAEVAD